MAQYSIRPKRSAIRAQAAYFLHSMMPSVTCLRLSYVSVICRVTYIQFLIQSAFLPYIGRQAAPALQHTIGFNTQCRTSVFAENLGRKRLWIDSNGKKWRHLVEGQFGSEFPAICNHYGVMAAWSCKIWKFCKQCLRFFEKKRFIYGNVFKILFRKFSPIDVVVKFVRREIGRIVRYLSDQKN